MALLCGVSILKTALMTTSTFSRPLSDDSYGTPALALIMASEIYLRKFATALFPLVAVSKNCLFWMCLVPKRLVPKRKVKCAMHREKELLILAQMAAEINQHLASNDIWLSFRYSFQS